VLAGTESENFREMLNLEMKTNFTEFACSFLLLFGRKCFCSAAMSAVSDVGFVCDDAAENVCRGY
jgi:hypothetical protein